MTCRKLAVTVLLVIGLAITATLLPALAVGNGMEIVGVVPQLLTALGDRNARYCETSLGAAVADAARVYLSCDTAIICGGDLAADLYPGEVTFSDISTIFTEDRQLAVATITINDLRNILEAGLSHITIDKAEKVDGRASAYDGFPQISGFVLRYDASAPPGQRVLEIKINGATAVLSDETSTITLAATAFMLKGGYGLPAVDNAVPQDVTITAVTARYISDGMAGDIQGGRRITVVGADNDGLLSIMPVQYILMVPLLFVVAFLMTSKDRRKRNDI